MPDVAQPEIIYPPAGRQVWRKFTVVCRAPRNVMGVISAIAPEPANAEATGTLVGLRMHERRNSPSFWVLRFEVKLPDRMDTYDFNVTLTFSGPNGNQAVTKLVKIRRNRTLVADGGDKADATKVDDKAKKAAVVWLADIDRPPNNHTFDADDRAYGLLAYGTILDGHEADVVRLVDLDAAVNDPNRYVYPDVMSSSGGEWVACFPVVATGTEYDFILVDAASHGYSRTGLTS